MKGFRVLAAMAGGMIACSAALAAPVAADYTPTAKVFEAFINSDGALAWDELDGIKLVKWATPGPILLKTSAPDGSSFSRPGLVSLGGQTFNLGASGSHAGVGSIYISEDGPAAPLNTVLAGLTSAGIMLTPARCPRDPARPDLYRGWFHILAGKLEANLYIGRLANGRQGYTLFLGDFPTMTQNEAANFVDCRTGSASQVASAAPATGQAGIVAVIEALLRPAGGPATLPWRSPLPAIEWNSLGPQAIPRGEWSAGGTDMNPRQLNGTFKTPTTEMTVAATGNAAGANRFYLEQGENLPRDAVFGALRRDGYTIKAVTCGKAYIKMSENWFRIAAPGKQPAILYRSMSVSTGRPTESYAVRLDNVAPPVQPGQHPANGAVCPG